MTGPRPATRADVPAMAGIVVGWEAAQDWLPAPLPPEPPHEAVPLWRMEWRR